MLRLVRRARQRAAREADAGRLREAYVVVERLEGAVAALTARTVQLGADLVEERLSAVGLVSGGVVDAELKDRLAHVLPVLEAGLAEAAGGGPAAPAGAGRARRLACMRRGQM